MALLAKPVSQLAGEYAHWSPTGEAQQVIQWSLDARRLMILGPRYTGKALFGHEGPDTQVQPQFTRYQENLKIQHESVKGEIDVNKHSFKTTEGASLFTDYVSLVDIDAQGYNKGHRAIRLPFIPTELNYNIDSTFAPIKPMGRNNPKFHYTGSEDRLEFEIDWYSSYEDRTDVIANCRMIEALSKGDAYSSPPHRVILQWGANDILFKDHIFVVINASYRLTNFNKATINQTTGAVESTHLLPVQAYQKVTLARITSTNLSSYKIELVEKQLNTSKIVSPTPNAGLR